MDRPQPTSPPSILVYDFNSNHQRRRSSEKSSSPSTTGQSLSPRGPMPVPGANEPLAPPPLPPPRYIEDLANGHDSGWKWGNSFQDGAEFGKSSTLAPIKPSSSLFGGHSRPALVRRNESFYLDDETKKSAVTSTMSSPKMEVNTGLSPPTDAPFPGSLASSLSSPLAACSLQGEKPLSEKSVERSSNAYDQHLLSKIGKPGSPPRQSSRLGSVGTNDTTTLPFHSKNRTALPSLSIGDSSLSPQDAVSRWNMGAPSAAISPGTRPGWSDYVGHRNPSVDSMAPTMDIDSYNQTRDRRTGTWSRKASDDVGSISSRSNRGSYDQGFPDSDADFSMDESGNFRSLHPDNRRVGSLGSISPLSKQGMKRRASSPPRGAVADGLPILRTTTSNGELNLDHRRMSGFPFNECASPGGLYPPSHGSVSSASSISLRTGSYASSAGLSVGGSSITSMSSFDRLSPGGISPISDIDPYYDRGAVSPGSHKLLPATTDSRTTQHRESAEGKGHGTSMGNTLTVPKPSAPRMSRMYICKCCHKKPKKFDNIEDLRAHEMEKQYTCHFCNKRFKNKNEAERHQNSLHLRRHSWSCAALSGYEAAFHPSSSATYQTPSGPSHDTCGYCGDEFTNYPQPEWDRRIDHLTNVHKFGECNQAKKFYRADHFRQHLKHSHAGASGKWTNILENACMKEESSGDANFPGIGAHGGRLPDGGIPGDGLNVNTDVGSAPIATMLSSASHTIDEAMDES